MRTFLGVMLSAVVASLLGCDGAPPPVPSDLFPSVTLSSREDKGNEVTLTFTFEHMERANWNGRLIRAQILGPDGKPAVGGPILKDPPGTITVAVALAKDPGSETVLFVPMWGKSDVPDEALNLPAPGGQTNTVVLPGYAEHRIRQVIRTATGPNRAVPFQPEKGIDLVTVGMKAPDIYVLRVWVERN